MSECDWTGAKVGWSQWHCINFASAEVFVLCCWCSPPAHTLDDGRDQPRALGCFLKMVCRQGGGTVVAEGLVSAQEREMRWHNSCLSKVSSPFPVRLRMTWAVLIAHGSITNAGPAAKGQTWGRLTQTQPRLLSESRWLLRKEQTVAKDSPSELGATSAI